MVTSEQAAAALSQPELQASDLVPHKYEGAYGQPPATAAHSSNSSTPPSSWLIGSMQSVAMLE
jgi:hypothetical protein